MRHNSARCHTYRERVAVRRRQPLCSAAPIGSRSIFAARRSAAEVTLGLRTWIHSIGNHVSVSIRESHHGALVHREQTQAARCRRRCATTLSRSACIANRPLEGERRRDRCKMSPTRRKGLQYWRSVVYFITPSYYTSATTTITSTRQSHISTSKAICI